MSDQLPPTGGPGGPDEDRPAPLIPSRAARHQKKSKRLFGGRSAPPSPAPPPQAPPEPPPARTGPEPPPARSGPEPSAPLPGEMSNDSVSVRPAANASISAMSIGLR